MNFDDQPDYLTLALLSGLCGYAATVLPLPVPIQLGVGIGAAYLISFAYLKQQGWW